MTGRRKKLGGVSGWEELVAGRSKWLGGVTSWESK
jgi:hypothetical protein